MLADSSAWIEYLRNTGSPVDQRLRAALSQEEVWTTGPVMMEVMAGSRDESHARALIRLLASCRVAPIEQPSDFESAALIYRTCRMAGLTVRRLHDCLIAAVAIRAGLDILHRDADFDAIARCAPLSTVDVGA